MPNAFDQDNEKFYRTTVGMIAHLMRGAYSCSQLHVVAGVSRSTVYRWLKHFYDQGLVYIVRYEYPVTTDGSRGGKRSAVYSWCDGPPFSRTDAANPAKKFVKLTGYPARIKRYEKIIEWKRANPGRTGAECAAVFGLSVMTVRRATAWDREMLKARALANQRQPK